MTIGEKIKSILSERFHHLGFAFDGTMPEHLHLSSLDLVYLVFSLEKELGVHFPLSVINEENFKSAKKISELASRFKK